MWIDILGAVAIVGQCADAFTTYWGIYILKMDSEGNTDPIVQWIAKSKFRLLTIKPAVAILSAVALHFTFHNHLSLILQLTTLCSASALASSGIWAGLVHNLPLNLKQARSK